MSQRLQQILEKIGELEKQSPYNFCDRWCERCPVEKRVACRIHHLEMEQRLLAAAHDRDESDPEVLEQAMRSQFGDVFGSAGDAGPAGETPEEPLLPQLTQWEEGRTPESGHSGDEEDSGPADIHPVLPGAKTYMSLAYALLEDLKKSGRTPDAPELRRDIETLAWYHILLPVKIERGLAGLREAAAGDDFAIYDAVAQFEIARKAVRESSASLRNLRGRLGPSGATAVRDLIALLEGIAGHIRGIEESL